jgi:hypothetical protein
MSKRTLSLGFCPQGLSVKYGMVDQVLDTVVQPGENLRTGDESDGFGWT